MNIPMLLLAITGIFATAFVGWLVDRRTERLLKRVENIQVAEMPPEKYRKVLRLLEDMERSGEKRGTLSQSEDGSWHINYAIKAEVALGIKTKSSHKEKKN